MINVCYVYQPHFNTGCFRVACNQQLGSEVNYIVVTCSPMYNGIYQWNPANKVNYKIWYNKTLPCYQVPILDCQKVIDLSEVKNEVVIKKIKKQQKKWFKGQVENGKAYKTDKPEWML